MRKGRVVEWNDERGFGFLLPEDGGRKVFFHITHFPQRRGRPKLGQECLFDTMKTDRGDSAVDISPIGALERLGLDDAETRMSWVALLFLAGVVLLMIAGRIPFPVPVVYVLASLWSFSLYERDKIKAEQDAWRVPEKRLHLLSLFGGWPGALMAQQRYRHKTHKASFRSTFWTTVTVNCAVLTAYSVVGLPSQTTLHNLEGWVRWSLAQVSAH